MATISIAVDDTDLNRFLEQLTEFAEKKAWLDVLGHLFVQQTKNNITQNKDWNGNRFAPNSPTTLLFKHLNRPLLDTEHMRDEIAFNIHGDSLVISSNQPQSAVLQFGAKKGAFGKTKKGAPIPWGDIPARPYFPDDESAKQTATDFLMECVRKQFQ